MDLSTIQLKDILVPVDGSQASMDALALACLLAKRNKGRVYAVYVVEVARTLPLDADLSPEAKGGEEILARAEQVAESLDIEITGELLQGHRRGNRHPRSLLSRPGLGWGTSDARAENHTAGGCVGPED